MDKEFLNKIKNFCAMPELSQVFKEFERIKDLWDKTLLEKPQSKFFKNGFERKRNTALLLICCEFFKLLNRLPETIFDNEYFKEKIDKGFISKIFEFLSTIVINDFECRTVWRTFFIEHKPTNDKVIKFLLDMKYQGKYYEGP